ncbi:MAG: NapC/NirT family cytochrome c [Verrucomicrobiota bacterium]
MQTNQEPEANEEQPSNSRAGMFRNWLAFSGAVVALGSIFSFLLLLLLDSLAHFSNPYIGLLTYVVAPGFLMCGLGLIALGAVLWRLRIAKAHLPVPSLKIDFSRRRDRKLFACFLVGAVLFLLISAVGSYQTFHYTESVQFCGQACHSVMKPELVAYQHSPHARVACVECHVGHGATGFVEAKLAGTHQLYALITQSYSKPVPTPVRNLRPARDTCEECHWPQKFAGDLDRTYNSFLGDETNTPFTVRMTLKVGGGDPMSRPVEGIHWHINGANRIEYLASDDARQKIPYVRVTDAQGVVTEFVSPRFTNNITPGALRTMDCIDCHNRPGHNYQSPNDAVNQAMAIGKIDRGIKWIKTNAVYVLTRNYTNETEALQRIATHLVAQYPSEPRIRPVVDVVQQIYRDNFFPEMNARWDKYPNNIGHKDWPGCFRCHDGTHKTGDGKRTIKASDCNTCHNILTQGSGADLKLLSPSGQKFKHPGDEVDGACNDCHNGGL